MNTEHNCACKLITIFNEVGEMATISKVQGIQFGDRIGIPREKYFPALEYAQAMRWVHVWPDFSFILGVDGPSQLQDTVC